MTLYRCPKGHVASGVVNITTENEITMTEAMPYVGQYCFVCAAAFIAANIPHVEAVEDPLEFKVQPAREEP